ncbi:hypothetical protein FBFR_00965 [Flavobacterium fryxellicola]|uniref:Uncharacterized protein n=1 Tax=Flavobacterium fryxellicola TaxID=249352 RepID=A0A168AFY6_9FLAO|nr:hypothetical protein FBFR_00965 [Flavobacterium fryxellicola]
MHSCSLDDALIQKDSNIQTVSREQAIQFLQQNLLKGSGNKTSKTTTLSNYDAITLEKITNSDQLLTVIPLPYNDKQQNSRVLLLTVNDTLKSAVFTMYPDVAQSTKEFSGRVIITSMNGDFFKGFRMKNGYIISKFIKKSSAYTTNKIESRSALTYATEPIQLHEVIIPARKPVQSLTVAYLYVYSYEIESSNVSLLNWGFSGGGGGGGEEEEVADPCLKIKAQIDNVVIKAKIDALKGKTANKNEAGIVQKKDGTFADMIAATNSNELNMPPGTDFTGSMHTHQDPYSSGRFRENGTPIMLRPILIFSPKDVVHFLEFLNNTKKNNAPITEVYSTMISSSAVYQLRFTGNITDVKIDCDISDLNIKYVKSIKDNGNDKKLGFLKFLEDNIGIKGIELYEINSDNSTVKITLDNNKISNIPCK